jgi:hypothetical protein
MAHPYQHAVSSARKFGGIPEDYVEIHKWFDETKAWVGHSKHRMFRHHSEGIFECVAEQHVKEDCNGYIPSAKEWVTMIASGKPESWAIKTLKIED